jgi:acyl-CoA synthetase (NDP forming)
LVAENHYFLRRKVAKLAIVITPAATVPEVLRECVEAGVRNAIVVSASNGNSFSIAT